MNPFTGKRFYTDPNSLAMQAYNRLRHSRPADADLIFRIASQPQAVWLGEDGVRVASAVVQQVRQNGEYPVFVLYNIPNRDNSGFSAGGAHSAAEYRQWIDDIVAVIGAVPSAVIVEPDSLAHDGRENRYDLIAYAVTALLPMAQTAVYIDAAHPNWHPAADMARFLERVEIGESHGFALNVSNFRTIQECARYGNEIARLTGKPFVVDTSRSGLGPDPGNRWCNPPGRAIGAVPTANTGNPLIHAYLWIKRPGESDGSDNGGIPAGQWHQQYALELVTNVPIG